MGVYSGADSEVPKEVDPGKHLRTHYYESVSAPEGRIPRPLPAVVSQPTRPGSLVDSMAGNIRARANDYVANLRHARI